MSESEEEFASADEGDNTTGKTQPGTEKPIDKQGGVDNTTGKTQPGTEKPIDKQGATPLKSKPIPSSESENQRPAASKSTQEKSETKAKGKNSKQKRKQGNKNKNKKAVEAQEKQEPLFDVGKEDKANSETVTEEKSATSSTEGNSDTVSTLPIDQSDKDLNEVTDSSNKTSSSHQEPVEETNTGDRLQSSEELEEDVANQTIDRGDSSIQETDSPKQTASKDETASEKNNQSTSGWGNWSSWGNSFVSAATASVSTFTSQVGEGFNTVLETVETSLGAPTPEELAEDSKSTENKQSVDKEENSSEENTKLASSAKGDNAEVTETAPSPKGDNSATNDDSSSEKPAGGGWLAGWGVSDLTHLVSDTGKTLVSGSLDVLETIGKKTYDALSEHDPGIKAAIKGENKPNLSSLLREAKDQAAERSRMEEEFKESQQAHFGAMFDEYQGLAHLEALEMLSNQSERKVQALLSSLSANKKGEIKDKLMELRVTFELEELDEDDDEIEHDFKKLVSDHLVEFHSATSSAKLNAVHEKIRGWLSSFSTNKEDVTPNPKEIHKVSIQSLAELTSKTVEQYHKAGELLLLKPEYNKEVVDRAKALASLTQVICTEVGILSTRFTQCLNQVAEGLDDTESINAFITNVYLEASNSSTYIQDAFQLLLPVLQQALIEKCQAEQ